MMSLPCFANCVHSADGECLMNVIGSDRLAEVECACEFYRQKNKNETSPEISN